jgi:hypothetical protein
MAKEVLGLARRAIDSSRPPRRAKRGHPRATRPRTRPPGSAPPTRGPRRRGRRCGVPDRFLSDQPPRSRRRGGRGRIGRTGCVVSRAPSRLTEVAAVDFARTQQRIGVRGQREQSCVVARHGEPVPLEDLNACCEFGHELHHARATLNRGLPLGHTGHYRHLPPLSAVHQRPQAQRRRQAALCRCPSGSRRLRS